MNFLLTTKKDKLREEFLWFKMVRPLINLAGQDSQMANKISITEVLLLLTDDLEVEVTVRIVLYNSSLAHP